MFIARLVFLVIVAIVLSLLEQAAAAESQTRVRCGMILGGGKTYVLDRNLICGQYPSPYDPEDDYDRVGMIKVIEGATLNLNGHTVTCDPRYKGPFERSPFGVIVQGATVRNGAVKGCGYGIVASYSVVKGMTLIGNGIGIASEYHYSSGYNSIMGNVMEGGGYGFYQQETQNDLLVDNVARGNRVGFYSENASTTAVGNLAIGNRERGFEWWGGGWLIGNRAEENGVGFQIRLAQEVSGNVARQNVGDGFHIDASYDVVRRNIARGNGGDGFSVSLEAHHTGVLSDNQAFNNKRYGFGAYRRSDGAPGTVPVQMTKNTAMGNRVADLADDSGCVLATWEDNRFETAAQPCIH